MLRHVAGDHRQRATIRAGGDNAYAILADVREDARNPHILRTREEHQRCLRLSATCDRWLDRYCGRPVGPAHPRKPRVG
jgi:hypothetical protein